MFFKKFKFRNHFPIPDYLSMNPGAIDIAPSSIRLMRLKKSPEGLIPDIYKEIVFDTPKDLTDNDIKPEEIEAVVSALKKFKEEFKIKYVVSSLPEQKTYIFRTQIPKEAKPDIADAIKFSLEENVPLAAKDANFDYFMIEKGNHRSHIDVVVNVFPKSVIKFYTDLYAKAGLTVIGFQSESVALASAVIPENDDRPYLLIRLMDDSINAAIVEDGIVQYTFGIRLSIKSILASETGADAVRLREELNKLLIYWFTSKNDAAVHKKIEDAIVVGVHSMDQKVIDFFEKNLKINVRQGNIWANNSFSEGYIPKISKEESSSFGVTIGLAHKAIANR